MSISEFLKKRLDSFKFAFNGMKDLLRTETHVQLQAGITLCVLLAGMYFEISRTEWIVQILAIALVLSTEALNTAIEHLSDFVHPEFHKKIGRIKDIAAAGVTFSALAAGAVGIIIYWPYVKNLIID